MVCFRYRQFADEHGSIDVVRKLAAAKTRGLTRHVMKSFQVTSPGPTTRMSDASAAQ